MDHRMNMEWPTEENGMMSVLFGSQEPSIESTMIDNQVKIVQNPLANKKPQKIRFKEPIFVDKIVKNSGIIKKKQEILSDSEDEPPTEEQLKSMSTKERRLFRNRISARNFRVRRKEYIIQLEQRLDEKENTITELRKENEKLRKANQELSEQILSQPLLLPFNEENVSSSSEGQSSPEPFQFPLDNFYDLGLFDQPEQPMFNPSQFNTLFLNHAAIPNLDIHRVLSEKIGVESGNKDIQEILSDHPLLGAALMSIVLRHTMSLEYVVSTAKKYIENNSEKVKETSETEEPKREERNKIKDSTKEAPVTKEEIQEYILKHGFHWYALGRVKGASHEAIIARMEKCLDGESSCKKKFFDKMRPEQTIPESKEISKGKLLHTYCKVAAAFLKDPKKMTQINKALKEKIKPTLLKKSPRDTILST